MALQFDLTNIKNHIEVCFHRVKATDSRHTIRTEAAVCDIRDRCTLDWCDVFDQASDSAWQSPRSIVSRAEAAIIQTLTDLGLTVTTENRATDDDLTSPSSPLTIKVSDYLGNTATLDWDPMQDSFDISQATAINDEVSDGGMATSSDTHEEMTWQYKPLTEQIIWTSLMVDLGEITDENAVEFYVRAKLLDLIYSSVGSNHYRLTIEDIRAHVGLKTNVRSLTRSKWLKKLQHQLAARLRDFEQSIQ